MALDDEMELGDIHPDPVAIGLNLWSRLWTGVRAIFTGLTRRQKVALGGGGLVVLLLLISFLGWRFLVGPIPASIDSGNPLPGQKPTLIPTIDLPKIHEPKDQVNPLNGNLMTKTAFAENEKYQPIIVMVENHVDSRPQSGLLEADIVYETLVEGGITRFLLVFWENAPQKVGPVRSMRKYFLDLASEYPEAPVMHIGQASSNNPETDAWGYIARNNLKSLPVVAADLFWREPQPGLAIEHTAYSSIAQLRERANAIGWGIGPPQLTAWSFKDDPPKADRPAEQKVLINWGAWEVPVFQVDWDYDAETNFYSRSYRDGTRATDGEGKQLRAKTIIVQFTNQTVAANEPDGKPRLVNQIIGNGDALVFRDGSVTKASWGKPSRVARTLFTDQGGETIRFTRGPIWVEVVPENSQIEYQP